MMVINIIKLRNINKNDEYKLKHVNKLENKLENK